MKEDDNVSARSWIILVLLSLIWGSSFILMKKGMEAFSPQQVAALRISIAALCLFPFVIRRFREIEPGQHKFIIAVGFLGNGIPAFLFTTAQTHISSSAAGILNALTPLFTLLVSIFIFRTRISIYNFIGVILGFIGAGGLILVSSGGGTETNYLYGTLIVIATVFYAFSVNIIRNKLYSLDSVLIAGWALFSAGLPAGIFLFTTDFTHRMAHYSNAGHALMFVCILAVVGTAISLVIYNKLIKSTGALFASSSTYFIPVVALMWGMLDNEKPGLPHLAGLATILVGVYLVNKKSA